MDCEKYGQMIPEHEEGGLDPQAAAELETHLKDCAACRQELNMLKKISSAAKELDVHQPGAETVLKIKSFIYGAARPVRQTQFGPVMDVDELAEFLRIPKQSLEEYLEEIPFFELGGKLLFNRNSIEKWIKSKERHSYSFETECVQRLRVQDFGGGTRWKT